MAVDVPGASLTENDPVASDIPTLVLAGDLDPITPPDNGREAARSLARSQLFVFPGFGHGVLVPNPLERIDDGVPRCAMQLVAAFLEDPTQPLDAACVGRLPGLRFVGTDP